MKTSVKIWIFWNGDYVKINLKHGQDFNIYSYQQTEEGFASESHTYYYDAPDGIIERAIHTDGRDCDGRLSNTHNDTCRIDQIHAGGFGRLFNSRAGYNGDFVNDYSVKRPLWDCITRRQSDQYAEMAGY
jgi:hypothetical protein